MNRVHLAAFRSVANEGGFGRAAAKMLTSQSTLSAQVAELEKALSTRLLDRLPSGVRPTAAGVLLLNYSRRIADLETEAERAVEDMNNTRCGHLVVGASTTIGAYFLPGVLGQFRRAYPGITLSLEIANTDVVQQQLLAGTLDLGLTEGLTAADGLDAAVFHEDELIPIVPPGHPLIGRSVSVAELVSYSFVMREKGSGTRAVVEQAIERKQLSIRSSLSIGSTEGIKRAVMAGLGVAIVSRITVEMELRIRTIFAVDLTDLVLNRPLYSLLVSGRYISSASSAFLQKLAEATKPQG